MRRWLALALIALVVPMIATYFRPRDCPDGTWCE